MSGRTKLDTEDIIYCKLVLVLVYLLYNGVKREKPKPLENSIEKRSPNHDKNRNQNHYDFE